MKTATLIGIELQYDIAGSGEPVLLISTGPIADSFLPFVSEKALADRYRLITYHQRRMTASTTARAGELRAACGRRRRAARPSRYPSRPCRRPLDGRGHRPPTGRRPSRHRSHTGPAGTAAGGCARRRGLLREGGTGSGGLRLGRSRGGDGAVSERSLQPGLGNLPHADRQARPGRRGAGDEGRRQLLRQLSAGPQRMAVRGRAGSRHLAAGALGAGHADRARGSPRATTCSMPGSRRSRTARSRASATCCTCSARSRWRVAWPSSSLATPSRE